MVEMRWINGIFIVLLSEAWSRQTGPSQSTSVKPNVSPTVSRHAAFNLGSDAKLTCSNKTWDEIIYVIWKINLNHNGKQCKITFSDNGQNSDNCNDGKSLRNTSSAQSYLHIPNFSQSDEGVYKCDLSFKGGAETHEVTVATTVPPRMSSWTESRGNTTVAVCKAEGARPAASISWNQSGNSSYQETEDRGYFTVVSSLKLTEGMDREHLKCAISHPFWEEEVQILTPESSKGSFIWLIVLAAIAFAVVLAAFLYFAQTKLSEMRRAQRSDTSAAKSTLDVEEVEPYASYVQRVNSIYNSSIDLFS